MPHSRFSSGEINRRGKEIYDKMLKSKVETKENIGRLISIDIESGDSEIGDDPIATADRLFERHPGTALYGARIGYNAMYALGTNLLRTSQ